MAQRLNDGTSGDVVIRHGPPAAGSGSGGGSGGGGGGGNRVGASGNFGGPSSKTRAARKRALREFREQQARAHAETVARAQEQARAQTRQQMLAGMAQRHGASRAEADRRFAARAEQLTSSLQHSISDSQGHDSFYAGSRWYLYRTEKEQAEVDRQIAYKTAEIHANTALAYSFDGHDPLSRSTHDYLARLDQFGDSLAHGHQVWENAYAAAHLARFLSTQVTALTEQSSALARRHAKEMITWQMQERQRLYAEQRDVRVRFKQQSDQDIRIERIKQANTVSYPKLSMSAASVLVSGYGVSVPSVAEVLDWAVRRSLVSVAGIAGPHVAIFVVGMTYPSDLGNGELTPEQRSRLFHAVGIPGVGT